MLFPLLRQFGVRGLGKEIRRDSVDRYAVASARFPEGVSGRAPISPNLTRNIRAFRAQEPDERHEVFEGFDEEGADKARDRIGTSNHNFMSTLIPCKHKNTERISVPAQGSPEDYFWCKDCGALMNPFGVWQIPKLSTEPPKDNAHTI